MRREGGTETEKSPLIEPSANTGHLMQIAGMCVNESRDCALYSTTVLLEGFETGDPDWYRQLGHVR